MMNLYLRKRIFVKTTAVKYTIASFYNLNEIRKVIRKDTEKAKTQC